MKWEKQKEQTFLAFTSSWIEHAHIFVSIGPLSESDPTPAKETNKKKKNHKHRLNSLPQHFATWKPVLAITLKPTRKLFHFRLNTDRCW